LSTKNPERPMKRRPSPIQTPWHDDGYLQQNTLTPWLFK